jgi:coenzyme F420-reducing hydrogenase alpha subunit
MSESPQIPSSTSGEVRGRREHLFDAMMVLEERARAAADEDGAWRAAMQEAADRLDAVLAEHIEATEAPGGFFEDVADRAAGRLSSAIEQLRRDHERGREMVRELQDRLAAEAEPERICVAATKLFEHLQAHRHEGAAMLWEAYELEIGVGD